MINTKKQKQAGFAHLLIPLVVILIVAVVGTFVLVASKAATCPVASGPVSGVVKISVSGVRTCQVVSSPVSAPVKRVATLRINFSLPIGKELTSANGAYRFVFRQRDNNLVVVNSKGTELWSAGVAGKNGVKLQFRGDGNLVLRDPSGKIVWQSSTYKKRGTKLVMQNDGRLVMLASSGREVWATTPKL